MDTAREAPADLFGEYVLLRIARDPSLLGESAHTVSQTARTPGLTSVQRRLVHRAATAVDAAGPSSGGVGILKAPAPDEEKVARAALVQRAVVDRPLLPLGAAHLSHDTLWPAVHKAAQATKQLFTARAALRTWEARHQQKTEAPASSDLVESGNGDADAQTGVLGVAPSPAVRDVFADEGEALRASVRTSEAAAASAREELGQAFEKVRRRVAAMEAVLDRVVCEPTPSSASVTVSRKRGREPSTEATSAAESKP